MVETEQQAETAVITVIDDPPAIALFTSPQRLQLFDTKGKKLGQGPDSGGVGRILRTAPGWLAAATDRQIVLMRPQAQLVHASRRQLGAAHSPGHQARRLRARSGPGTRSHRQAHHRGPMDLEARVAISRSKTWPSAPRDSRQSRPSGGQLQIFDPAGESAIGFTLDPTDPPLLIEAPEGSPPGVSWVSLARRAQWLRGHNLRGEVVWDRQIPWEGWSLVRLGRFAVIASADGRALACDGSGADSRSRLTHRRLQQRLRHQRRRRNPPYLPPQRSLDRCNDRWTCALACRHRATRRTHGRRAAGYGRHARKITRLVQERIR